MEANIRVGRIDVTPVDDHLGAIPVVSDGVDAPGERTWVRATLEQRKDRSLGGQPLAKRRNIRQPQRAPSGSRDLGGVRKPVAVVGIEDQFSDQFVGAVGKAFHLIGELAG
jgi:hypothetical protein